MGAERVAAEVTPRSGQGRSAAAALQDLGFRVLHIGSTISVDAPPEVWARVFGGTTEVVPESLRDVVTDVAFARPPDLH